MWWGKKVPRGGVVRSWWTNRMCAHIYWESTHAPALACGQNQLSPAAACVCENELTVGLCCIPNIPEQPMCQFEYGFVGSWCVTHLLHPFSGADIWPLFEWLTGRECGPNSLRLWLEWRALSETLSIGLMCLNFIRFHVKDYAFITGQIGSQSSNKNLGMCRLSIKRVFRCNFNIIMHIYAAWYCFYRVNLDWESEDRFQGKKKWFYTQIAYSVR